MYMQFILSPIKAMSSLLQLLKYKVLCQISLLCLTGILNIAFYNITKKPSRIHDKETLNRKESFPWDDL